MGTGIELKYLVKGDGWRAAPPPGSSSRRPRCSVGYVPAGYRINRTTYRTTNATAVHDPATIPTSRLPMVKALTLRRMTSNIARGDDKAMTRLRNSCDL